MEKKLFFRLTLFSIVLFFVVLIFSIPRFTESKVRYSNSLKFTNLNESCVQLEATGYALKLLPSSLEIQLGEQSWQMKVEDYPTVNPSTENGQVWYKNIFPNIDLTFYDKGRMQAGYDFIVHPGGLFKKIEIQLAGGNKTKDAFINEKGELALPVEGGHIIHSAPIAYQEIDGEKKIIASSFVLKDDILSFDVGNFDRMHDLVIDPTISFERSSGTMMMPPPSCAGSPNIIAGFAWEDLNADGVKDAIEIGGIEGITVQIFDEDGTQVGADATTDADGNWSVDVSSATTTCNTLRVEYSGLPSWAIPSVEGADNGTRVQFVAPGSCANLGIVDRGSCVGVSDGNPNSSDYQVVTPCYINGGAGNTTPPNETIVALDYDRSDAQGGNIYLANKNEVGATWGLAYSKQTRVLYMGAFLKRHVGLREGLATNPLGAIYQHDLQTNTNSLFLDISTLGVNVGTIPTDAVRGLTDPTEPSQDAEAYAKVGKVGIGDIDISDDEMVLYVMSLNDKTVYAIDIASKTLVGSYPLPDPGCTGGEFRPFGLKFYRGELYAGGVCDASMSQQKSDLAATIYRLESGVFNQILSFNLDYPKGAAWQTLNNNFSEPCSSAFTGWFPWADVLPPVCKGNGVIYPQPILSDIEFDRDGSLIIGFMDRNGHQLGQNNYGPTDFNLYATIIGGDILRAAKVGNSFQIEQINNINDEYYNGDFFQAGQTIHRETSMGGLARLLGLDEVAMTAMDPKQFADGGVYWLNNSTGNKNRTYQIYLGDTPFFGKANGLGDLELIGDPAPIQIGNYVWEDTDEDGTQDACEAPLPGISVSLYDKTSGDLVAVTTTGADGEYYFTNNATPGESWFNGYTKITINTQYAIVFGYDGNAGTGQTDPGTGRIIIGGNVYELTTTDSGQGSSPDLNDSDASLMTQGSLVDYPIIMYTTTDETNHSLDAGFKQAQSFDLALTKVINTIATPGPYAPGDNVTFTIEVFNQGNVDATDVEITDYVSTDMIFNVGDNTDFSGSVTTPTATIASILAGASATVEITLQIDPNTFALTSTNNAEITNFDNDGNLGTPPPVDDDSTPGDNQGSNENATDNDINDEWPGTPGTIDNPNDNDDYDPAMVMIDQPPCVLEFVNVQVNCTSETEYELSFEVAWDYVNATTDMIDVTINGIVQPGITPASATGMQSFGPIMLTGPAYDIPLTASFVTNSPCISTVSVDLIPDDSCVPACTNTLGGTVFQDFDNDGNEDAADAGQANVLVEIYECDDDMPVATTYTNGNGDWSVDDAGITYPVRVEFSTPLQPALQASFSGTDNGTNVQFVDASNCNVDYGLIDPDHYCQENPQWSIACYVLGNPALHTASSIAVLEGAFNSGVVLPTNATTFGPPGPNGTGNAEPPVMQSQIVNALTSEVGAVRFMGYHRSSNTTLLASYMKRYSGFPNGPNDNALGTIYAIDRDQNPNQAVPFFTAYAGSDVHEYAHPAFNAPTFGDTQARDLVGFAGWGDIDVDEENNILYAINYHDALIYMIPFSESGGSISAGTPSVISYPANITNLCSGDDWRPGALKVYKGYVYTAITCTALTSQNSADLHTYILRFPVNTTLPSFEQVTDFALDYVRQPDLSNIGDLSWQPWVNGVETPNTSPDFVTYPMPHTTDIDFDEHGNILISISDRKGDYSGTFDPYPNLPTGGRSLIAGDLLRGNYVSGTYIMEDVVTGVSTNPEDEFFIGDGSSQFGNPGESPGGGHREASFGAIATLLGQNTVVEGSIFFGNLGGIRFLNTEDGSYLRYLTLFTTPITPTDGTQNGDFFGKSSTLGDIEFLCEEKPIQVGNYVWNDQNNNGVQDACEPALPNFTVKLYTKPVTGNAELVATTTTDANGEYYFTNSSNPNETWEAGFTELVEGESYFIVFMGDSYDPMINKILFGGIEYELVVADSGEGNNPDFNDSDASIMNVPGLGDMPVIMFVADETDHTLDAGMNSTADYGDLPDTYATLATSNGARHSLKAGLYLGSCVDIENTGAPDFEAGTDGTGGDDQTPGILTEGTCTGGDDEDGVTLLTQLIPGSMACIEVTATSATGAAVLNAWIDFNGDGDFAGDPNENLTFTSIDGAPITATTDAPVANGTGTYVYCFDVSTGATFPNQETHMRFRLSMNGGLPYDGPADSGEVEDYYQPLAKIGNIAWEDLNGNGIQDGGEPGFAGVDVTITGMDLQGNPVSATVTTGADGMYMFPGLLPNEEYCIHFDFSNAPNAQNLIFTPQDVPNNMDEVNDSDADPQTGNAGCYILNPLEYNPDVDAGIYSDKDGDFIPDMMDGDMNNLDPQGYIYCENSGEIIPGGLVNVTAGPGVVNMIQDGSTGEYQFFVSQPGTYTIAFTPPTDYVVSTACLDQGLLDPDPMDPSPFLVGANDADNDGFLDDSSCGANPFYMQFTLDVGEFILLNNIPLSCAEIGDTVWEDNDTDGIQDPGEPGVPDITVLLFECTGGVKGNQIGTTTTDASGNYEFTGLPGNVEYCVQFDLASSTNPNAGLYFFTTQDQISGGGDDTNDSDANPVNGCTTSENVAPGEEYDDFDAGVYLLDFGDLPEGTGYPTTLANMGPAHAVPSAGALLKLGATVDAETDGQPSADALGDGLDEDGVSLPMFMTGVPEDIDVSVMNMTGSEAKLVMYVDWNNDGDFEDVNEMYSVMVPDGATVVTLDDVTPPLTANLAVPIGIRFRISTDQNIVMSPTGLAPDGEVEDYLTPSMGFDYGDLNDVAAGSTGDPGQPLTPADYQTTLADNGPGHKIVTDVNDNPILKIGSAVDDEADGQPSADAGITGGDDNAIAPLTSDPDDEDGLDENNLPLFITTQTTQLDVPVMNMTGADATIAVFVDFNKDGAFDPGTERFEAPVPDGATTVTVPVGPIPVTSVVGQDVGLRIRLANNPAEVATAVGIAQSGEVEDYMVQIVGFDYGDLPDSYSTLEPDGPKHIVNEDLLLGSCVDVELDGQEESMAGLMSGGDDNGTGLVTFGSCANAGDDEDGIVFTTPLIPGNEACIEVTSVNNTGSDAVLQMWVDYNGDGAFGAGEEVTFTSANGNTIPDGGVVSEAYCFDVPSDATFFGGAAFVRFRLSPLGGTLPDSQDLNTLQFGEVEDYKLPLYKVGSYVWDDLNGDGLQDDFSSPCMDDVEMQLVWGGPDDNLATTGDNQTYLVNSDEVNNIHGQFVFCGLIPGSYELSIAEIPSGLAPTVIGAGTDPNYDSNDPNGTAFTIPVNATLPTGENGVGDQPGGINGFPDEQDNLSFDFGLMTDGYTITCNCDGSITLDWDPFAGGDSWTVTLEDENGFPALDFVNMPDHVVTIAPGSLNNGECYRVAITENLSGNEVTSIYGPFHANCYPVPEISMTGVGPTCPDSQDGEVTITITEQGCAATYDVYLTSQNGADVLVGDDIQITAPIVVPGLGEDTYGVRMELVDRGNCAYGDGCFPLIENDLLFLQNTDTEPPTKVVYDASGAEVTDMVITYDALPEGECGVQFTWSVVLDDNCLSAGVNLAASITTSSANPSVSPSASVTVLDNTPTYAVEVFAGVGTNTLTLTATDANGNENVMVYTINVADNRDPVLYCPSDMNVEIPSCEDEAPVNWTVSVVDDCDLSPTLTQTAGPASGDVLAPGIYNVSYEASDDYGNTGSCSFTITVTQAPSPAPIVDVSGNGNYEIEHCEEDGLIVFSGNVYDCDLDAASFNPADLIVQTIPLSADAAGSLQISYTLPQDGYVYFEATGNLTAGSYLIITTYQGVTVDHGVIVSQDADEPAVIDMPGNLSYQAADCEAEVPVSFAVQLSDDCDEDLGSASFTINGVPAPPYDASASDPVNGLYVWNLHLSAGTYTIGCTYTDGGGNVSQEESTITVNGTQDDWAPIITYPSQNMDVELDPCGPPTASVVFEVTATDDCDGDLTPTVAISGGSLTNVGGTNTYIAMVSAGGCETVTITATDAAGNTSTEDFQICVNQAPAPLAALICNDDINVTLNDNCQREITADMLLEGEFGCFDNNNFTITIQDDDPSNGNILDGCGEFIYEIDLNVAAPTIGFTGDFAAANWSVVEDAGSGDAYVDFTSTTLTLGTLAGNDAIAMIPMPDDGTISFDYDYSGADPSWDFFIVDLDGNQIIDVTDPTTGSYSTAVEAGWMLVFHVDDDGAFPVGPNDPSEAVVSNFVFAPAAALPGPIDFQPCWGYITGEDKTAPVLECPANTGTGTIVKNGYVLSGTIDTNDPTVVVNDWSCLIDNTQGSFPGERYVDIIPFQVDESDVYTFLVESDVTQTGNVGFAIYQGSYDVNNPCEHIIAQADIPQAPGVGNPLPGSQGNDAYVRLALPLQAGATYYLATTTFTPEATGNYQYSICSDENGQVGYFDTAYVTNPDWSVDEIISFTPVPTTPVTIDLPLHCEDFDAIYNNPSSLSLVGSPIVSDNCDQDVEVTFEDSYEQFGDCGDIVITRTFTAVDDKGNSSSCTQVITLSSVIANNRGDTEVWLPPFTVPIECDEDYPTLANGNPTPAIAGYPFVYTVSGIFDLTQGQYCNVGASFEDSPSIVVCDGAFKFTRTWTIVDWCNPIDFYTYSQIIKVGDFTAPTVICPGEDYDWDGVLDAPVYSTSPFACTAAFEVPLPAVEDNCSDYEVYTEIVTAVEVDVVDQYGQVTGTELDTVTVRIVEWDAATRYVSGIPMGDHYFYYSVEDDCGNQTEVYCPFSVEDQIEPTAVCDDDLHVSIAGNDYARIYAEDINEGSWDNCGIASIEVRRNLFDPINFTCGSTYSTWGDYVDFFCCDAGVEIEIQLRVIDESGNVNTCWLNVTPEEKVRPYCEAPHNVEVDCTELPYDFDAYDTDQLESLFGSAIATDNCSGAAADELPPVVDLECGFGRVIRRFRATDEAGNQSTNFCQQIVDIHEVHNYEIRFPADAEAICGVAEPDSVIYEELACDLLAVSHTDEFFSASGEECYKIFRTWKVINWCEYDGESAPMVIGRDEDCDGQPGDEAVWVLRRPNGYTYIDRDNDETEPNNVPLAFQNICQGWDDFWRKEDTTPGYYEYTQIIKVYDDVDPIITAEDQTFCSYDNVNCDGVVAYPFSVEENCTPEDLTIKVFLDAGADGGIDVNLTESGAFGFSLTGTYPDYVIGGEYPIGCHAFEVHVEDGCGNVNAQALGFCVEDCKAPAPICINGLAIELMPFDVDGDDVPDEGRMAIWASDFIASPITDCSEPVVYSMNRAGEPKNIDSTGIVLTCADTGTLVVEIWAWDAAGNSDFCETYINVQDNMGNCGTSSPGIAGAVETEYESPVEDVTMNLSGQGTASMLTNADGTYSFTGLVEGYDYTIIPERDGDYLNGVSTFDLVLISQHILGVQLLDSPYKRIAADVNNSESITTLDLIQLRKLILSIDTEFSNNTSWRFVDAAYVFPNPLDPWQEEFPELVNVNDLSEYGIVGVDFIAVKIGDVTEDAETTSLLAVEGRELEEVMYLKASEVAMKAGEEYTVNFSIEELQNIYGYQATLNFNTEAVELVDILEGVAGEDNFGFTYLDEGLVATSWNWVPDTEEELPTTVMYSLVVRAKADANLSEVMSVNSRITKAEAYATSGEFMDVELSFGLSTPIARADQFELYQNQPNPANGETLIGFNLPEAATATLTISDITGKAIKLIRLDAVKGYNSVMLNAKNLPKGVLQYTVNAGQYTDTKSMIIME